MTTIPDEERCVEERGIGSRARRCVNRRRWHVKLLPGGWEGDLCGVHAAPYRRVAEWTRLYGDDLGREVIVTELKP